MKWFSLPMTGALLVCTLPVVGTSACHESQVYREHTVRRQDEAAAVTVSTTLVAHWDDYVPILAPKFKLKSGDEALAKVIPQTMAIEEKILRMFGASLGISARDYEIARPDAATPPTDESVVDTTPPAALSSEDDETEEDADEEESDDSSAEEEEEADAEEAEAAPATPSAASLPGIPESMLTLGQDPMLQYLAATALYQEVQLLNRYIENAALRRDYKPYVVRLQIGVTPYARNMPYDVYATVSFFGDRTGSPQRVSIDGARRPEGPPVYKARPQSLSPVLVTPLLVTDNLEGALRSRAVNTIRDLTVALSVLTGKVDVDTKLSAYTDKLSRVLGTDLNSLLTVAQINDNSVRIRLGAARQATAGHAIIPRTHNVTLLVLVPNEHDSRKLHVEAATELRHATDGDPLDNPSLKSRRKAIHKKLKQYSEYVYSTSPEWAHYCYENLKTFMIHEYDSWTGSSDFTGFEAALYSACETTTASSTLWMELVELHGNQPYARTSFELPEPRDPRLPAHLDQEVVLHDNPKTGKMTATVYGGKDLKKASLSATLELWVKRRKAITAVGRSGQPLRVNVFERKKDKKGRSAKCTGPSLPCPGYAKPEADVTYPLRLRATDIRVRGGAHGYVKLTFPSVAKRKLGEPLAAPRPRLTIRQVEDSPWREDQEPDCLFGAEPAKSKSGRRSYVEGQPRSRDHVACAAYERIAYVSFKADEKKPKSTMTSGVKVIRASRTGTGQFSIRLSTTETVEVEAKLKISGAEVTQVVGAAKGEAQKWTFKIKKGKPKDLTFKLANLTTRSPIKVEAQFKGKGEKKPVKHAPLELWVEPLPLPQRITGSQ